MYLRAWQLDHIQSSNVWPTGPTGPTVQTQVNCLAYWFIAPYIRDIPHLNDGQAMSKLIPATARGTMGRTFLTGDAAFKAREV